MAQLGEQSARSPVVATPDAEIATPNKSVKNWFRETPKGVKAGLAAVVAVAGAYVLGTQSRDSNESNAPAAAAAPEDPESLQGIQDASPGENQDSNELTDSSVDTSAADELAAFEPEPQETINSTDWGKDEWLESWGFDSNYVNGPRAEQQSTRDFFSAVLDDFASKIAFVSTADSAEAIQGQDVANIQYLAGLTLLVETKDEVIAIENPVIYGIRPTGQYETNDVWAHSDEADAVRADYQNFALIYPDQENSFQTLGIIDGFSMWPYNDDTRIVGAYMHRAYVEDGPQIIRGVMNWGSLVDTDGKLIIDNADGSGRAVFGEKPLAFPDVSAAWDAYAADTELMPVQSSSWLSKIVEGKQNN